MTKSPKKILITINGMPGSGKGTIGGMLSKKIHIPHYSIGDIFRHCAKERGMKLVEYIEYGETHPSVDREPDRWAAKNAKRTGQGIYDGRTMFHIIPQSIKIFLDCSLTEGTRRIMADTHHKRKHEADLSCMKNALASQKRRIATDRRRYRKYYNIDIYDHSHYDLVVDTTNLTPKQVLNRVMVFLKQHPVKMGTKTLFINNGDKKNKVGRKRSLSTTIKQIKIKKNNRFSM